MRRDTYEQWVVHDYDLSQLEGCDLDQPQYVVLNTEEEVDKFYGREDNFRIDGTKVVFEYNANTVGLEPGESFELILPRWYGIAYIEIGRIMPWSDNKNPWIKYYGRSGPLMSHRRSLIGSYIEFPNCANAALLKDVVYSNRGKCVRAEVTLDPGTASHILVTGNWRQYDDSMGPIPALPSEVQEILCGDTVDSGPTGAKQSTAFSFVGRRHYNFNKMLRYDVVTQYVILPYHFPFINTEVDMEVMKCRKELFQKKIPENILRAANADMEARRGIVGTQHAYSFEVGV